MPILLELPAPPPPRPSFPPTITPASLQVACCIAPPPPPNGGFWPQSGVGGISRHDRGGGPAQREVPWLALKIGNQWLLPTTFPDNPPQSFDQHLKKPEIFSFFLLRTALKDCPTDHQLPTAIRCQPPTFK